MAEMAKDDRDRNAAEGGVETANPDQERADTLAANDSNDDGGGDDWKDQSMESEGKPSGEIRDKYTAEHPKGDDQSDAGETAADDKAEMTDQDRADALGEDTDPADQPDDAKADQPADAGGDDAKDADDFEDQSFESEGKASGEIRDQARDDQAANGGGDAQGDDAGDNNKDPGDLKDQSMPETTQDQREQWRKENEQ